MSKNALRNRLSKEGMTFRNLHVSNREGFVLRVMDTTIQPPQLTTVVRQPAQATITTETHQLSNDVVYGENGESRYAPAVLIDPVGQERVAELLESIGTPLAETALKHLSHVPGDLA